jgi:hypothetical protein
MWLNVDLIINHLSISFTSLLRKDAHASLLLSREVNPKNGIANTGCMMLCNTVWARGLLSTWWRYVDHSGAVDQHAVAPLLAHSPPHIVLLAEDTVTSEFPGLAAYQDRQTALHLATGSIFVRAPIVGVAWKQLCSEPAMRQKLLLMSRITDRDTR